MRTRVLGLGNTILRDDGVGIVVARQVAAWLKQHPKVGVDVVEAETAGFALLELLNGCERAIIIDAVDLPGLQPGELVEIEPDGPRTSPRLCSVHEMDLPTALALGRQLGHPMPTEVFVIGVQVEDMRTFGEELTAAVTASVSAAVEMVIAHLG